MKRQLAVLLTTLLAGCFPTIHGYYKSERAGATYFGGYCLGGAGPPSVTYFPYAGIFLSVAVAEEPNSVILGVHVPSGNRVHVLDRSIVVSYKSAHGLVPINEELKPAPLRGGNPDPWEFRTVPSPFGKEDYFGELTGDTRPITYVIGTDSTAHKTYLFKAPFAEGRAESGTISFPTLRVNDKTLEGPVVPFNKSTDFEISPINC